MKNNEASNNPDRTSIIGGLQKPAPIDAKHSLQIEFKTNISCQLAILLKKYWNAEESKSVIVIDFHI